MKLSMWMIAEKLEKYSPILDIREGNACLTGVRMLEGAGSTELGPQYVYLDIGHEASADGVLSHNVVLQNGVDRLVIRCGEVNVILNELLAAFDFYNAWETALWEASARKSFQQIIDLAGAALENPMMIADRDGGVFAMSSMFAGEDINEYWIESRVSGRVPLSVLGAPMRTMDGGPGVWSDTPQVYVMPDGTKTIGAFLSVNGDLVAGFGLWEYKRPIYSSDVALVEMLCDVLRSALGAQKQSAPTRTRAAIIADLLSGIEIDGELIHTLKMDCKNPWRLMVMENPFSSNAIYRRNLLQRLVTLELPCVPLLYEERVLALVSEDTAQDILDAVIGARDRQYCVACISLPFDDLLMISSRYEQVCSMLRQAGGKPGIYHGEEYALQSVLLLTREQIYKQGLLHPALHRLKSYDAKKHGELYETLYQYLLHERSIQMGADAMHVHKNTFLYRLQKIRELLGLDLDKPNIRAYLLLSYLVERA